MACIRKRRGKPVVDYRDAAGKRHWKTCETRREADLVLEEVLRESRQPSRASVDLDITVATYSERWLALVQGSLKPRTVRGYRQILRFHLIPLLGNVKIRQLSRGRVKVLLADKLREGLARNTVRIILAVIRSSWRTQPLDSAEPSNSSLLR
jgi:hypothetical protein